MNMPKEVNRVLTDRISNLLFCPTTLAVKNLESEGLIILPIRKLKMWETLCMKGQCIFQNNLENLPN